MLNVKHKMFVYSNFSDSSWEFIEYPTLTKIREGAGLLKDCSSQSKLAE